MKPVRILPLLLAALPAACGSDSARTHAGAEDPVMAEALEGQLMVDPDLSQQNLRNYAVVPAGPADPALPVPDAK